MEKCVEELFLKLVKMVEKLRSDDGCPWDREQGINDWMRFLQDEIDELNEGVKKEDWNNVKEELGDVMFLVVMLAQVCKERGLFTIQDVLREITDKVERRHPHVFGNMKARTPDEALRIFYRMKAAEKKREEK